MEHCLKSSFIKYDESTSEIPSTKGWIEIDSMKSSKSPFWAENGKIFRKAHYFYYVFL